MSDCCKSWHKKDCRRRNKLKSVHFSQGCTFCHIFLRVAHFATFCRKMHCSVCGSAHEVGQGGDGYLNRVKSRRRVTDSDDSWMSRSHWNMPNISSVISYLWVRLLDMFFLLSFVYASRRVCICLCILYMYMYLQWYLKADRVQESCLEMIV